MVGKKLLDGLGLHRKELRAWALYDWANSAFATTIMVAILPVFYANVAAVELPVHLRTAYWAYTASIALFIIAISAPLLGAISDAFGTKKKFLAFFVGVGVLATACLFFVKEGDWLYVSMVFIVANVGFALANIFYNALLPQIASRAEIDRVSVAGYAIGYLGGAVLLAINIAMIFNYEQFGFSDKGQATRFVFLSVAVWWTVFSVPLFKYVKDSPSEPSQRKLSYSQAISKSYTRLATTFRQIRQHREPFKFLLAFWLYNDGIGTIIKMATIYGREIGIGATHLIGAVLLVQVVGIPFTFAFGAIAGRIGAKRGIYLALCVYTAICVLGYFMTEAWHFWLLAIGVGMVQGGSQALSRSFFARMIPASMSSEFFGFYSLSDKFAGLFGPLIFGLITVATGQSRLSILFLIVMFVGGMLILSRVKENA